MNVKLVMDDIYFLLTETEFDSVDTPGVAGRRSFSQGSIVIGFCRAPYALAEIENGQMFLLPNGAVGVCQNARWLSAHGFLKRYEE